MNRRLARLAVGSMMLAVGLLVAVGAVMTPSAHASIPTYGPTGTKSIRLSTSVATPGGLLTVSGTGFHPHEEITIVIHSAGELIGATRSSSTGTFSTQVRIPSKLPVGKHVVVATDTSGRSESIDIEVVSHLPGTSPPGTPFTALPAGSHGYTGTDVALTIGAVAIIALGGLLVLGLRRRRSAGAE